MLPEPRGEAAHDRSQITAHALLDRGVGDNALRHVFVKPVDVVFGAVRVEAGERAALVGLFAADADIAEIVGVHGSRFAVHAALDVVLPGAELLGTECDDDVVGELVDHRVMIPAVAPLAITPARARGFQRVAVENPRRHVQGVNILLGDDVAGERQVQAPGFQLEFVGDALLVQRIHPVPCRAAVVGRLAADDAANVAVLHAFHRLAVKGVCARLKVDEKDEVLVRRQFARSLDALAAGHVHGNGFGEVGVDAGIDRIGRLFRMKVGRAFDSHRIDAGIDQPLVAGQTDEAAIGINVELLAKVVDAVLKIIGAGMNFIAAVIAEQFGDPCAAAAIADDAQFDSRVGCRAAQALRLDDGKGRCRAGCGDEISAVDVFADHVLSPGFSLNSCL